MGTDSIITLFFLIVAAIVFLNLRNVLGRRTGNEKPSYDPFSKQENDRRAQPVDDGKVVTLPRAQNNDPADRYEIVDDFAPVGGALNTELRRVLDIDPSFNPRQFVDGAKSAYEMIVTAYAEGDRKTLKMLLSNDVFEGFSAAIQEREKQGEKVKFSFVGIDKIEMTGVALEGTEVSINLKIVSQLISATYNKAGEVIDGDPDGVAEVKDRWTFMRDMRSRDPNWKLVATQSEG